MKKRGRPTKITPELTERVVYLIERGMNQKDACNLAGLAYSTYNEWKAKGDKGFEPYATFFSVTSRARNEHKALLIRLVLAGAQGALKGDWKAGSWLLSKGWPKEFGDRIAVDADPVSIPAPTIILATPNGRTRRATFQQAAKVLCGDFPIRDTYEPPGADNEPPDDELEDVIESAPRFHQ